MNILPTYTNIRYYLTIDTINKYLKLKTDWLKTIRFGDRICDVGFCPISLCLRNRKFQTTAEPLEPFD